MSLSKPTKYLEFDKRKSLEGSVWNHFLRAEDGQSGKCKLCSKILKCHGGATTGFHVHLKSMHCIDLKEKKNPLQSQTQSESSTSSTSMSMPTATPAKKHKMMTDFFNSSKEMDEKVSRMAALDGLPFSKFYTSEDLRDLFHRCGYKLPESGTALKRIVLNQFEKNKNQLRQNIAQDTTTRYSVTLDEYTSTRNRRYMNVNLHSDQFKGNFKNLGLVRIEGSMPAMTAYTYLKAHLKGFAVDLDKDVICLTTDGASVMIKMGRYYEGYHQICLAHGIQLGVTDVLYKNNSNNEKNSNNDRNEMRQGDFMDPTIDTNIFEPEHQDEDGTLEESNDDENEEFNSGFDINIDMPTIETERELNFKEPVEKIRKLVRSVRKSSLKNEAIQKYVREEFGKELNLVLDCKTRWSSLSDMIERFLKLKSCITKGFLDLDIAVPVNEESMAILKELHESLHVIKITVESLCTRDANLMTADTALKFMLKSLDSLNGSIISNELAQSLRKRIKERRLPLSSVLTYLYDSEDYHEDNFDLGTFSKPTGEEMFTEIIKIIKRLEEEERIPEEEEENTDSTEIRSNTENGKKDMKKELQQTIQNKLTVKSRRKTKILDLESLIRVEMAVYENGGVRGQYLQKCFQYLKTIPPTSVEAERAFSAVTYICNRVRSSLNDDSLNALTFLKFHYKQK